MSLCRDMMPPSEMKAVMDSQDESIAALRAEVSNLKGVARHHKERAETLCAENEKLRAALSKISEYEIEEGCPCNACQHSAIARAALKGEDE